MTITYDQLYAEAGDLLTEPGDSNPEYDRAIVELVTRLIPGVTHDDHDEVLTRIRIAAPRQAVTKYADHTVRLYRTLTTSVVVRPNSDGNVVIMESEGEEVIDLLDSNLFCDTCGMLGNDELADHGISEEWDEV